MEQKKIVQPLQVMMKCQALAFMMKWIHPAQSESFLKFSSIICIKFIVAILFSLLRKYRAYCQLLKRENALLTRKLKLREQKLKIEKTQIIYLLSLQFQVRCLKRILIVFFTLVLILYLSFQNLQSFIEPFV